jgi:translation initiation factor 3 subunit I
VRWDRANKGQSGEVLDNLQIHEMEGGQVTDLQWAPDRTYFITASKDKTAKVGIGSNTFIHWNTDNATQLIDASNLQVMKTYYADTPLNSATITPKKEYVILGGGQDAMNVTQTTSRQGKFEARFYHKIFEDEVGRVRGHFGPLSKFSSLPLLQMCLELTLL